MIQNQSNCTSSKTQHSVTSGNNEIRHVTFIRIFSDLLLPQLFGLFFFFA